MKTLIVVLLLLCPVAGWGADTASIDVYFSPHGGGTDAIVQSLQVAKREVLVQAYSFTSSPIAKALLEAKKRGVAVTVVLDKSQNREKYTSATFLSNSGVPVFVDSSHAIAHNKVMIIDHNVIITGSFNFTKAAEEKNAENLLVIAGDKELSERFIANFNLHLSHSLPYTKK